MKLSNFKVYTIDFVLPISIESCHPGGLKHLKTQENLCDSVLVKVAVCYLYTFFQIDSTSDVSFFRGKHLFLVT